MSAWPNKYVIGLTGNIAVGKSVVRKMLQHLGAYTIDADGLVHQAMSPGAPAYKPIVEAFGKLILDNEGRINRAALGRIVFSNPQALAQLESITHPIVRAAINTLVSRAKQRVIVIEAIKLIEGDLAKAVDVVWVVNAKPETQYRRLIQLRGMTEADAKQRILAQNAQGVKLEKAHVVIQNDGDVEETWKQVQMHWNDIRRLLTGEAPAAPPPTTASKPAQPAAPAPAAPPPTTAPPKPAPSASGLVVRRGMPGNAAAIADFIKKVSGKDISRMDIMLAFGQKSYLLAESANGEMMAVMGWTVENLVTRMDEFYTAPNITADVTVGGVLEAIEEASKELQSEVAFAFLPKEATPDAIIRAFQTNGYQTITLPEIKIPAWREAVEESTSGQNVHVLWKQLREDRVLQPI